MNALSVFERIIVWTEGLNASKCMPRFTSVDRALTNSLNCARDYRSLKSLGEDVTLAGYLPVQLIFLPVDAVPHPKHRTPVRRR